MLRTAVRRITDVSCMESTRIGCQPSPWRTFTRVAPITDVFCLPATITAGCLREIIAKTYLGQYLAAMHGAIVLENGHTKDLSSAYNAEPIVVFNYPRSQEGSINYHFLELLKDGCIFSSKYESRVKTFTPPKVVCFANFPPMRDALSADRWWLFKVQDDAFIMDI
ncbi:hypothetical protein DPMN_085063 [Dreissena polymorpha]|uniref:Uncharacterized protein n=1 Tax=Dreissena polymorpha TaxID=45954 RepID=A0A9D3YFH4_DREPO|nr:hypothetical protein DPMN_085063 [Dreissena polymorpha]